MVTARITEIILKEPYEMSTDYNELSRRAKEKYGSDDDDFPCEEPTTFDEIGIGFLENIRDIDIGTADEIRDAVTRICREHGYRTV